MRTLVLIVALAASSCLPVALAAQAAPDSIAAADTGKRAVLRQLRIRNVGQDASIVLLTHDDKLTPWRHASKLKPGASETIAVPDLAWLLVRVLGRDEVRAAAGHGSGKGGRNLQALGLALAVASQRDGNDNDRHENQSRESRGHEQYEPRGEDRNRDSEHQQEANGGRHWGTGLLLQRARGKDGGKGGGTDADGMAGDAGLLDAADGEGERQLGGIVFDPGIGEAEGSNDDDADAWPGGSIAISQDPPPPAQQAPAEPADPCYCGPDVTAAYVVALQRAHDRIKALPESEIGPWDGAWFLSRNAGTMDEIARGVPIPGKTNTDGEAGANMLCPSGPCGNLPGAGSGTLSICGVCLPKHVGNDIMYGFVGYLLGVPSDIQDMGGHYAQIFSAYSSLDPPQSRAAYAIGNYIANLSDEGGDGGPLKRDEICKRLTDAQYYTLNTATQPPIAHNAVGFIQETYPALANCPGCPTDATQPGTLLRDWTTSSWTLDDGTRVHPPGFDPNAPAGESE